jgi:hypothetical protein
MSGGTGGDGSPNSNRSVTRRWMERLVSLPELT